MTPPGGGDGARVVVVGAGIAGLTAAHTLVSVRPDLDVVVLEASDRAGGKLWSTEIAEHRVDAGADAFLARVPEAVELCRELGLGDGALGLGLRLAARAPQVDDRAQLQVLREPAQDTRRVLA